MNRLFNLLPEISGEEMAHISQITRNMSDDDLQIYANIYRARRKDQQLVLILGLVGLFFLPGLQRFLLEQIGMGVLFLFTLGLCFIGSILDLVNYKTLANEYNIKKADEVMILMSTNR
ncbi:MAG: TM2 domain-containing protein [Cyclobacteriaceae bacterium]|nr:TM2 domain-containing protein [Cyclobacteriaceae bacterium]